MSVHGSVTPTRCVSEGDGSEGDGSEGDAIPRSRIGLVPRNHARSLSRTRSSAREGVMVPAQLSRVIRHLHRTALARETHHLSDAQLLERYLTRRDDLAFEALVRRHGPMVLGVCRRILGNAHDAEDAFQATFLVLVRKAARIVPRQMVGNWLYGVASRTATKARALRAKRSAKESAVPRPRHQPA